jgi:type VI secretion system ImpM family protein
MKQGPIGTGCFGKRPAAADYIHHHQGGRSILDWQRWIQDGVALASARFGAAVEPLLRGLRTFQFAFPGVRSDAYLVGSLGPGEDRSGRLFPFTVFAEVSPEPSASVADLVLRQDGVWRQAALIVAAKEMDLPALFTKVDDLAADDTPASGTEPDLEAFFSRMNVGALTFGNDGDGMRLILDRVTRNLRRVALQAQRDHRAPAYGLRFPLPVEPERATAARLVFLAMSLRVLGPKSRPTLFWTAAGRDGFLDIHPGPAGSGAFLHLLDPSLPGDAIFAMDEDLPQPGGGGPHEEPAESCWSEPERKLQEALDRCGRTSERPRP